MNPALRGLGLRGRRAGPCRHTEKSAGYDTDMNDTGDPCALVVIGGDRNFTFAKILRALGEVVYNGATLIATNADATYPAAGAKSCPAQGRWSRRWKPRADKRPG